MRLAGKVAVVTGGGSGIGKAICLRLADDGAKVAVLDVNEDSAAETADAAGGAAVHADVSDSASVDAALAQAESALGPVDVWVNNAGVAAAAQAERVNPRAEQQLEEAVSGPITTPLEGLVRLPDDEWRRMLAVHLDGTFFGTRAAARSMARRGTGSIVNIASICGIAGCAGYPHYSAAKGGILAFTRAVAKELIVQGVRVNAVAPGFHRDADDGDHERPPAGRRCGCRRRSAATAARRRWRRRSRSSQATTRRSSSARP